jgi:hypothetical protein
VLPADNRVLAPFAAQATPNRPAALTGLVITPGDQQRSIALTAPFVADGSAITTYQPPTSA